MSVLITGGNGFIGSHLADALTGMGEKVTLFDLQFNGNTARSNAEKVTGDVRHLDDLKKAVRGKDAIFHFAAVSRVVWGQERPHECVATNAGGTLNMLEAMRHHPGATLFLGSSREVYGEPRRVPVSEDHPKDPISIYGISKLSSENLCAAYSKYFGIKTVIFRFSNVYGTARDLKDRVIPKFVARALAGEPLELNGGGQILDFTHIEDTLAGILSAYRTADKITGEDIHFVTGKGTSVGALAEKAVRLCGSKSEIRRKDGVAFDVRNFVGDPGKASRLLGWKPKIPLDKGLQRTIEQFSSAPSRR